MKTSKHKSIKHTHKSSRKQKHTSYKKHTYTCKHKHKKYIGGEDTDPDKKQKRLHKQRIATYFDTLTHRLKKYPHKHKKYTDLFDTAFNIHPYLGRVLQKKCHDPDNCLALGKYATPLKTFFQKFADLSLVDNSNLKRLGAPSGNGFVVELPFVRNRYTAYTALKCSQKASADNLFYEAVVGTRFINKYVKMLPCFVETYECYTFKNEHDWKKMLECTKTNTFTDIHIPSMLTKFIPDGTQLNEEEAFGKSCEQNKLICILIQHFNNVQSMANMFTHSYTHVKYDLYNLLYQVYYALCQLGELYTHYDLHANNVLLYKPYVGNQYITMRYHRNGRIYEFNTEYICKIIDYGRNYINIVSEGITSQNILDNFVCSNAKCEPNCGIDVGYNAIQGTAYNPTTSYYNIWPNVPNVSIDLKLAYYYKQFLYGFADPLLHLNICDSITYTMAHGTPEDTTGTIDDITTIYNMRDALERKMGYNRKPKFNALYNSAKYDATWKQAAIMDIFDDGRPYTFTEV